MHAVKNAEQKMAC